MDGVAIDVEFFALAIAYDEIETLALGVSCPFDESAYFAVIELRGWVLKAVGHLDELLHMAAFYYDEVNFIVFGFADVVESLHLHPSQQFNSYHVF